MSDFFDFPKPTLKDRVKSGVESFDNRIARLYLDYYELPETQRLIINKYLFAVFDTTVNQQAFGELGEKAVLVSAMALYASMGYCRIRSWWINREAKRLGENTKQSTLGEIRRQISKLPKNNINNDIIGST